MRNKDVLTVDFDDIKILMQYLYLSDENTVKFNNGACTLEISMSDDLEYRVKNLNFPDLPLMKMELNTKKVLNIIKGLKSAPAEQYPERFKTRWDEVKEMTLDNLALNMNL